MKKVFDIILSYLFLILGITITSFFSYLIFVYTKGYLILRDSNISNILIFNNSINIEDSKIAIIKYSISCLIGILFISIYFIKRKKRKIQNMI